ncbi:16S rRNA (cytosine(1402)-N(4))-methyltransferase RsmH [Natranaerobius trueperi]|uniref:Ribosomal RNA small subunit methyltransferase H n=1 Tax=Natranaerobius trueperi TaxID=759412 RepID=A0A226BYN1_9FIRM|nr:16S rRNA (cytosine(1402)-N(4))-methyltransferase RsmH [Natranaerobius trueperi]OWZ84123.1 16S rRNA (cytosine(1402)-N(4))-methyltransferase [Natranaerobius trueperi]
MEFNHKSVMSDQTIRLLNPSPAKTIVDGTMGGAGHSSEIVKRLQPSGKLIAVDQDPDAIEVGKERLKKYQDNVSIVQENFQNLNKVCDKAGVKKVDGILLDLGVSSFQLDNAKRGFTYQKDAPLDMRMDKKQQHNAQYVINNLDKQELTEVIKKYGEEKWAARIADFIVKERDEKVIKTTGQLVSIIKAAIPKKARVDGPHPAKRTFQALRIYVNRELESLENAIDSGLDILKPGGRFVVITFHSLEDRIVKHKFKDAARSCICPTELPICQCKGEAKVEVLTKKPILPTEVELEENPRARSAKLRAIEVIGSN